MQTATPNAVLIDPSDNVITVTRDIAPGELVVYRRGDEAVEVRALATIPFGHKVASAAIAEDGIVRKYGEPIGMAVAPIQRGEHVHTHNVHSLRAQVEMIEEAP